MPRPSSIQQAADLLHARTVADGTYTAFDPSILLTILFGLIQNLVKCQPTPQQGYDYLAWKPSPRPILDWLLRTSPAKRLYEWRENATKSMLRVWDESEAAFKSFVPQLWTAIDAGDLTPDLMAGMYSEVKGRQ